jgi:hypothetical protein
VLLIGISVGACDVTGTKPPGWTSKDGRIVGAALDRITELSPVPKPGPVLGLLRVNTTGATVGSNDTATSSIKI